MSFFAMNLLLAVVWMFMTANASLGGLLIGFAAGYFGLAIGQPVLGSRRYVRSLFGIGRLLVVFFYELLVANLMLARDLLRPKLPFQPGFVSFDATDLGPTETVLLAIMISITPGSLSVDLDDDGHILYVHSLYSHDPAALQRGFRRFANLIHAAEGAEAPNAEVA